jgi:hypothetical protein
MDSPERAAAAVEADAVLAKAPLDGALSWTTGGTGGCTKQRQKDKNRIRFALKASCSSRGATTYPILDEVHDILGVVITETLVKHPRNRSPDLAIREIPELFYSVNYLG